MYDGPAQDKPAACPTGYTLRELEAHQGLAAPPANCECTGGEPKGVKCQITGTGYSGYASGICNAPSPTATYEIPDAGCITAPGLVATRINAPVLVLDAGTCAYPPVTKTLPPPTFEKVNLACGLTQLAACPERADCIATPAPAFGRLCIHKQGEELCPSQDYSVRILAYAQIRDERECSPCSASPRGGNCGDASTFRFMTPGCGSNSGSDRQFGSCIETTALTNKFVDLSRNAPQDVECPAHQVEPIGGATSTDPVTFCCTR